MGRGGTAQAAPCPFGLSTPKAQISFPVLIENGLSRTGWQLGDVLQLCCPNRGGTGGLGVFFPTWPAFCGKRSGFSCRNGKFGSFLLKWGVGSWRESVELVHPDMQCQAVMMWMGIWLLMADSSDLANSMDEKKMQEIPWKRGAECSRAENSIALHAGLAAFCSSQPARCPLGNT